jgi:hypothetical protein
MKVRGKITIVAALLTTSTLGDDQAHVRHDPRERVREGQQQDEGQHGVIQPTVDPPADGQAGQGHHHQGQQVVDHVGGGPTHDDG